EDLKLDDTKIVERIHRLKELKCKLAIDDFGRGYSNLSYFLTLSPDILKIDGQIVKEVVRNENAKKIIRGIAIFCKAMKIEMVAEFVENEEIAEVLKKIGVDYGQGFYFGKPQPTLVFSKALDHLSCRSLCY
ncbi:MAG: EAL domain-containing protein, partial [Epsilonproteobacteria bacterium]|nr:EAL domain-containing protein [Campylobacterota bacterium]